METTFADGRHSPPPVPGRAQPPGGSDDTAPVRTSLPTARDARHESRPDDGQEFVARLRGAAVLFAAAAGARSAVVREVVPPARHRRSRCRLVLRYADGAEEDLSFLGPAGSPTASAQQGFDEAIRCWLGSGTDDRAASLVPDEDAANGHAVDITAWLAAR